VSVLFYRHCGGEVIAGDGRALETADLTALYGLHLDEARAAKLAGDEAARATAVLLVGELAAATRDAARWLRASSRA
jgi:hypothetical protein